MATTTIPEDLFIELMVWLPVKSLKRFRCLSKSLCAFIDSPDFIKLHLCNSPLNFNRKLIFQSSNNFHVFDVNLDLEDDILRLGKPVSSLSNMEIHGYCNGLLLISKSSSMYGSSLPFSLWNPSTGQCKDLPRHPNSEFVNRNLIQRKNIGCGLVYDDSNDEYKVIFVVPYSILTSSTGLVVFQFKVSIYELKSSIWRMTFWSTPSFPRDDHRPNKNFRDQGFTGIGHFSTDGILYLSYDIYGWRTEIVAFDVKTETFSLVSQPVGSFSLAKAKLQHLEGCLCISYFSRDSPLQATADLYIRKKDGVLAADMFSWTKLFSLTESLSRYIIWRDTVNVLGYSKRGDKILLELGMHMFSYDLKEKSFAKVEMDIHSRSRWYTPILCLFESLVSLGVGA